jgi:N-acetylmuramoyl-L-alanine amidase
LPRAEAPITALRLAARPGGSLRLVLELQEDATAALAPKLAGGAGESLISIAVRRQNAGVASVSASVDTPAVPQTTPTAAVVAAHAPSSKARDIVVAIDAGHGGDDPGASGRAGTQEKNVTLAIARELAERVDGTPGMHAILTRSSDTFVRVLICSCRSMPTRCAIAMLRALRSIRSRIAAPPVKPRAFWQIVKTQPT